MSILSSSNVRLRVQVLATAWACAGLVLAGLAWALGLEASWWQRTVLALPLVALAVWDIHGAGALEEVRLAVTRALTDLGWLQIPFAVAGGAWLAGLTAPVATRSLLAGLVALVAVLFRYAPSAPASTEGAR